MSGIFDSLRRRRAGPAAMAGVDEGADPGGPVGDLAGNEDVLRKQRALLLAGAAALTGLAGYWIFSGESPC